MAQHAMAQSQAFRHAMPQQNKGTLAPGQTISVNKYTVQVERYLSQGGFAHVYLVRTATPVYGTTHHVLKRIAVPNETMLTEVKKEVDIMRILRGHPNIVYLIDAAWHRTANGAYEVFILMEFCPGGGIIDMMNRRLRERLTEPEILTIFVEVCEGVAAMHALKPPLLHRDLKVENILQSSPTSYKLCDFGSATPVQKVPNNIAELRALEADLNRHTTLQYRAPEMVDVFLRRPIDEKSDVWALGVLLYKLCYYTTPFEEHGPLAILNVQYKIPPYPVYSHQMNALIASMLREHGAQRPTVFEILTHVHTLRGTKSRFTYEIPSKHPVSPMPLQALSPNTLSPPTTHGNGLDDLVMFKSRSAQATTNPPAPSNGVEARERVLEAIGPMRRGRPTHGENSETPPSPKKPSQSFALDMKFGFGDEEDRAWKGLGVRGHKSGMASFGSASSIDASASTTDPWNLGDREKGVVHKDKMSNGIGGFDSDFTSALSPGAGFGAGFGDSFQPSKSPIIVSRPTPSPGHTDSSSQTRPHSHTNERDAFEGLGLPGSVQTPPRTLGEAHRERERSRSGFGTAPSTSTPSGQPSGQYLGTGLGSSSTTYRPPSTHSPAPNLQAQQQHPRPPSRSATKSSTRPEMSAEERFPSLEELDRTFTVESPTVHEREKPPAVTKIRTTTQPEQPSLARAMSVARPPSRTATGSFSRSGKLLGISNPTSGGQGSGHHLATPNRFDGVRSQHVTGVAMRESRLGSSKQTPSTWEPKPSSQQIEESPVRPQARRHRSSILMKSHVRDVGSSPVTTLPSASTSITVGTISSDSSRLMPTLPPRPTPQPEPRDWLTGQSEDEAPSAPEPAEKAVLRESPRKRASYIERSPVQLQRPLEAENVEVNILGFEAGDLEREKERERARRREEEILQRRERSRERREREREKDIEQERARQRARVKEYERAKALEREEREKEKERQRERESARRAQLGREREHTRSKAEAKDRGSPTKATKAFVTRPTLTDGGLDFPALESKSGPIPISSSPSGLTENWSPVSPSPPMSIKHSVSSSSDEGPEELDGFVPEGGVKQKKAEPDKSCTSEGRSADREGAREIDGEKSPRRRRTHSARQNSVHDLVDLWGGNMQQEKDKPVLPTKLADKRRSAIVSPSYMKNQFRPAASTLLQTVVAPSPVPATHSTGRPLPRPPSSQQHRKEPSVVTPSSNVTGSSSSWASGHSPAPLGRSRPQSMFINPISRTTPLESSVSHSSSIPEGQVEEKQRQATRRTSISDMVQKYEAIGGAPRQGPPVANKPTALSVKTSTSGASASSIPSPSSAATRFPQLSPSSSPILAKVNLAVNEDSNLIKGRISPAPRTPILSSRPATANNRPSEHLTGTATGGLPLRKTPLDFNKPLEATSTKPEENVVSSVDRKSITSPDQLRSPSPEKPYLGVSKLIDRWQRVVDDTLGGTAPQAPAYGGYVPKKPGVASSSLRGR